MHSVSNFTTIRTFAARVELTTLTKNNGVQGKDPNEGISACQNSTKAFRGQALVNGIKLPSDVLGNKSLESPYSMNIKVNDSRISVGHLNKFTYFAIETPNENFGFKLDSEDKIYPLHDNELPSSYKDSGHKSEYHYSQPLKFDNLDTKKFTKSNAREVLIDCLKDPNKSVAIYTGAGISKAAGIDDLQAFNQRLFGNNKIGDLNSLITSLKTDSQFHLSRIRDFFSSLTNSNPTNAHSAISQIGFDLVFTENLDNLHEKAGTEPIKLNTISVQNFKAKVSPDEIKKIDVLVTTGLSHDDRGFIAYLREINPHLIVIANDLPGSVPNFLNPNNEKDLYLEGDAHRVFQDILEATRK